MKKSQLKDAFERLGYEEVKYEPKSAVKMGVYFDRRYTLYVDMKNRLYTMQWGELPEEELPGLKSDVILISVLLKSMISEPNKAMEFISDDDDEFGDSVELNEMALDHNSAVKIGIYCQPAGYYHFNKTIVLSHYTDNDGNEYPCLITHNEDTEFNFDNEISIISFSDLVHWLTPNCESLNEIVEFINKWL